MDASSDTEPNSPADQRDIIIRDDRADFPSLLDTARDRRAAGGRLILVDSGIFGLSELEWLGEAGVEICTSDLARREPGEFITLAGAAKRGGARLAYFHHGPFDPGAEPKTVSFAALTDMGRRGVHLYLSDGRVARDQAALEILADACRKGGTQLVVYRHRNVVPALEGLCRQGVWTHLAAASVPMDEDVRFFADCARAARDAGGGIILHVEQPMDVGWLSELFDAGAFLLFQTPPSDYRDPFRALERRAARRTLDAASFYLHPEFLL